MSKVKKTLIVFLSCVLVSLFSFGLSVSASTVYKCVYQQPKVDQYSGYVEVITNNNYVLIAYFNVFFRSRVSSTTFEWENISPKFTLTKTSDTRLSLTVSNNIHPDDYKIQTYVSHGSIHTANSGRDELNTTTAELGNSDLTIDYFCYAWDGIKAIRVYGPIDYSSIDNSYLEYTGDWVVTYGSDTALYEKLDEVKSSFGGISSSINSNADKNASQIQSNADKNASETQANDDKNTQAIIDNQNDLAEKEKTETQNQGEGSVNDVSGAIEDKSAGFISSIGNLVNAMSYNGTSCAWKFPALKLPAIDGVMSEIKLTDEKPIDFEYWVNKIPSNVLLLVRSLLTIALIGYCFKELYSTISYVLTLKGGGNSE